MKPAMNILLMLLLIGGHNVCRADTSDSITEIKETENWTMAYVINHPEIKYKTEELIDTINAKRVDKQLIEYFKDKPPGVRSHVSTIILLHSATTYYELITNNEQEWLCNSLIENSPTDGWYYPVLVYLPKGQNVNAILDKCITEKNMDTWASFVFSVEPNVNDSVKPVFDKIRSVIAARKADNKLEQ
jgi:hypothetical protein